MKCRQLKLIEQYFVLLNLVMIFILALHTFNKTLLRSLTTKSTNYRSCHDGQSQYNFSFHPFHNIRFKNSTIQVSRQYIDEKSCIIVSKKYILYTLISAFQRLLSNVNPFIPGLGYITTSLYPCKWGFQSYWKKPQKKFENYYRINLYRRVKQQSTLSSGGHILFLKESARLRFFLHKPTRKS